MFTTLLESARRPERRSLQGALSLVMHIGLGVGVIEASRHAAPSRDDGARVDTMVFVVARPAPRPPVNAEPKPSGPPSYSVTVPTLLTVPKVVFSDVVGPT